MFLALLLSRWVKPETGMWNSPALKYLWRAVCRGGDGEGEGALGTERHGGGGACRYVCMCVPCTVKVVLRACAQQRAREGLVVWGVGVQAALQAVNEARARA